jgi:hypothetical protein
MCPRCQRIVVGCTCAVAEPAVGAAVAVAADGARVLGAQRPEEAKAEHERGQKIHRVFDASLGVHRSVRGSGEVVEESVSRGEQQALMRAKARAVPTVGPAAHPPETYTGRDKFPSQHPWHGYK